MLFVNESFKAAAEIRIRKSDTSMSVGSKLDLFRLLRQAGFILVSLILRWVVWGVLGALRIFKIFDYLFLVYPGSASDLDGYCPRKLARSWLFSKKPTVGGIISKGQAGVRGLYFVVPNTAKEFSFGKDVCESVRRRLAWLNGLVGSRAVAVAGQVPGMMVRNGVSIEKPFVRGNKGTVFCIMETISEAMKKHGRKSGKTSIIIVGVGYVGSQLLDSLRQEGFNAIGIDIESRKGGYVALDEDARVFLPKADLVVVLTPKGSDFAPYVQYLKKGAIVIDDTHPKITEKPLGVHFYKVAVGMDGSFFYPRLPGYRSNWIPGCAVEAIMAAATGEFNGCSQKEFNQKAKELGFFARMVE
ncbi:hypothetical protein KJ784_03480 [Patescibacteria group bacterium]|nr:hypothetical protein [Patescibacteria group bacterium]